MGKKLLTLIRSLYSIPSIYLPSIAVYGCSTRSTTMKEALAVCSLGLLQAAAAAAPAWPQFSEGQEAGINV